MFDYSSGSCNGVAVWVDFDLDGEKRPKSIVSTGPTEPVVVGSFIKWDINVRQGVHLISNPVNVTKNNSSMAWKVSFKPIEGDIKFNFKVKEK